MKRSILLAACLLVPANLAAQNGWRLAVGVGPYRVDRLAGTPIIPSVTLLKAAGTRTVVGGTIGWIRDAGFYGLDALTFDFDLGRRGRSAAVEWVGSVGPTAIVGGDGDGTPYVGAGAHLTAGVNWWFGNRIGLTGSTTGRLWLTSGNTDFSPSASVGLIFRL